MNNRRHFVIELLLGVLIAVLLAMPVMAEMDATSTDIYAAQSSSLDGSAIDLNPVRDGSAFTQYDTVFFAGAMAESYYDSRGIDFEQESGAGHLISLNRSSSASVICPYFSYDSKQGGIQPRVRYLAFEYATQASIDFNDETEIYGVSIWNGGTNPGRRILFDPPLKSKFMTMKVIDLGAWYRFDRGLSMTLLIRNPSTQYYGMVSIGGYGARFEW